MLTRKLLFGVCKDCALEAERTGSLDIDWSDWVLWTISPCHVCGEGGSEQFAAYPTDTDEDEES